MAERHEGDRIVTLNLRTAKRSILSHLIVLAVGFIIGVVGTKYSWQFFTPSYILKTELASPGSLKVRDRVEVAGVEVGHVWAIGLKPAADHPVEVSMRIAKKYQPAIRADSEASVGVASILGGSYIDITLGSAKQPVLKSGDTVKYADRTASLTCDSIMKALSRFTDSLKNPASH